MANLGFFEINTNGKYMNLSELTGITFISGNKYLMQNQGGYFNIIESYTTPVEGGFAVGNKPFEYECDGTPVYIQSTGSIFLNISE